MWFKRKERIHKEGVTTTMESKREGLQEVYSTDFEYWQTPNGLLLLESWARDGYTIPDIANRIGITRQGFERWMRNSEEIKCAVNTGREIVDYKVENALLKAALGFKTKEVKVTTTIRGGKTIETIKEVVNKEMAPNVGACQTWLYNRKPDKWKSQNARNSLLDELDNDTSIEIKVIAAGPNKVPDGNASSTFEEPDTDWEQDVNKGVSIRKGHKSDDIDEQWEQEVQQPKNSKSSGVSSKENKVGYDDTDDLDYWPDDWDDE